MAQRFPLRKPPLGEAKAAVVVGDDVRFEHRLLARPVTVAFDAIGAVVRVTHHEEDDDLVLRRDVRRLDLRVGLADANVVVVLREPHRHEGFKLGAKEGLGITGKERRHGIDVDVLGVTADDPEGLVDALVARGVWRASTLVDALRAVVGESTGAEAVQRVATLRRRRLGLRVRIMAIGLAYTCLFAARIAFGDGSRDPSASSAVGMLVSSLCWALLVAAVIVAVGASRQGERRPIRDRISGWRAAGVLAATLGAVVATYLVSVSMASGLGVSRVVAFGLVAGVPGGLLWGLGLRGTRSPAV